MDLTALLPRSSGEVTLRALEHHDADDYAAGTIDPLVRRYAHLPEAEYSSERVSELIDTTIATGLNDGTLAVLAVAAADSDRFLGSLVVFGIDVDAGSAEVGFWLAPWGRGRGTATAALRASQDLARSSGLTRLHARTVVENDASRRVLERAGFRRCGAPAEDTTPSGETALVQQYGVAL